MNFSKPKTQPKTAATPTVAPPIVKLKKTSAMKVNFTTNSSGLATFDNHSKPLRLLAYGPPKARKTWFAATVAKNLRTTILDGDTNTGILNQLSPEVLENVSILPMNAIGYNTIFPQFIKHIGGEVAGKVFAMPLDGKLTVRENQFGNSKVIREDMTYILVNLNALTSADCIIIDSYTTFINGISQIYNKEKGIDPFKGEVLDETDPNKYAYFRFHEAIVKQSMAVLRKLPCSIIITAHQDFYTTKVKEGKSEKTFGNLQIASYSGTDGARIAGLCSDVIYMEPTDGNNPHTNIELNGKLYRVGGCTHVAPATKKFPGWDMSNFIDDGRLLYPKPSDAEEKYGSWVSLLTGREILEAYATGM